MKIMKIAPLLLAMFMLISYKLDTKAQNSFITAIDTINSVVVPDRDRDLYFVYIVHDRTSRNELISTLIKNHDDVKNNDQIWVFYLANGNNPVIVESTPEAPNDSRFEEMLNVIGRNEELYVNSSFDLRALIRYFNKFNYADNDGNILFNTVTWRIYTTSSFLKSQIEDPFIASVYWVFDDMKKHQIYFEPYVEDYQAKTSLGIKNYVDINSDDIFYKYSDLE